VLADSSIVARDGSTWLWQGRLWHLNTTKLDVSKLLMGTVSRYKKEPAELTTLAQRETAIDEPELNSRGSVMSRTTIRSQGRTSDAQPWGYMLHGVLFACLLFVAGLANATQPVHIKVYQDPNCGCCGAWVQYMQAEGFTVESIKTPNVNAFKQQYGVPPALASCHTGVVQETGQIIEGHVPANAVRKMLASPSVKGVSAPGMPMNSPGMGEMDGNLVTVDFQGRAFSRD